MLDRPTALEIIEAAIARLATVVAPALSGRMKFEVRVIERALQLAHRDLALAPILHAQEHDRLAALLGVADPQDLEAANRQLCMAIEAGAPSIDREALLAHLGATTREKLAVDQPDYPPLKQA